MSIFKDDEQINNAIKYFKGLTSERKAFIVSNLLKLSGEDKNKIEPLLLAILSDISNYDKTTVSNQLYKLGLDRTFAMLFVQNLLDQVSPLKYLLKEISSIADNDFKAKFPSIINDIIIEFRKQDYIMNKYSVTIEQEKILRQLINQTLHLLAGGSLTEKQLINKCSECNVSNLKTEILVEKLKIHIPYWRETKHYRSIYRLSARMAKLEDQNRLILQALNDLLKIIINPSSTNNMDHFR